MKRMKMRKAKEEYKEEGGRSGRGRNKRRKR
jgi:hypothetical protein